MKANRSKQLNTDDQQSCKSKHHRHHHWTTANHHHHHQRCCPKDSGQEQCVIWWYQWYFDDNTILTTLNSWTVACVKGYLPSMVLDHGYKLHLDVIQTWWARCWQRYISQNEPNCVFRCFPTSPLSTTQPQLGWWDLEASDPTEMSGALDIFGFLMIRGLTHQLGLATLGNSVASIAWMVPWCIGEECMAHGRDRTRQDVSDLDPSCVYSSTLN